MTTSDDDRSSPVSVTAAILVIGDEILSGRTKDKNIGYIAEYLTNIGIELREVRIVPDVDRGDRRGAQRAAQPATPMSSPPAASARPMTTSRPMRWRPPSASPIDHDPRAIAMLAERFPQGPAQRGAAADGAHSRPAPT